MDISRRREEFIKSYILMRQMAETLETALRLLEEPVQIPNRLAVATYISGEVIFPVLGRRRLGRATMKFANI
jgi:hypothetical protein